MERIWETKDIIVSKVHGKLSFGSSLAAVNKCLKILIKDTIAEERMRFDRQSPDSRSDITSLMASMKPAHLSALQEILDEVVWDFLKSWFMPFVSDDATASVSVTSQRQIHSNCERFLGDVFDTALMVCRSIHSCTTLRLFGEHERGMFLGSSNTTEDKENSICRSLSLIILASAIDVITNPVRPSKFIRTPIAPTDAGLISALMVARYKSLPAYSIGVRVYGEICRVLLSSMAAIGRVVDNRANLPECGVRISSIVDFFSDRGKVTELLREPMLHDRFIPGLVVRLQCKYSGLEDEETDWVVNASDWTAGWTGIDDTISAIAAMKTSQKKAGTK